jgi:hypothetical protein
MVDIRINNESLDISEGEFSVSFAVNDIANIETRQGDASTDFDIPYTAKNARLIGYTADSNVLSGTLSVHKKISASLYVKQTKINDGYIQVNSMDVKSRTLNITYYGGNTDFYDVAKSIRIWEAPLDDYNHLYSRINIINGFSNEYQDGYHYFPFDDGSRTNVGTLSMNVTDFRPAVFLSKLMERLFIKAGYKMSGNFLNNPIYKKISIPSVDTVLSLKNKDRAERIAMTILSNKVFFPFSGGIPILPFANYEIQENEFDFIVRSPLYNGGTGEWVADGNYTLQCEIGTTFGNDWTYGANGTNFQIRKNGVSALSTPVSLGGTFIRGSIDVSVGDVLTFEIYNPSAPSKFDIDGVYYKIELDKTVGENKTLFLADSLPDITFADLVRWVAVSFGLLLYVDNSSKTVYFIPFQDIVNNKANALDWSDKIDKGSEIIKDFSSVLENYGQTNYFKYTDSSDYAITLLSDSITGIYGRGEFNIDNDFIEQETDLFEAPFATTANIEAFKIDDDNWFWCPFIQLGGEARILINRAQLGISYFSNNYTLLNVVGSTGTSTASQLPLYYFDKETRGANNIDRYTETLNYATAQINNSPSIGMIDKYMDDYRTMLNYSEMLECRMKFSAKDILQLDFSRPIYLKQFKSYYYLNRIDEYDGTSNTSLVQLIKI